MIPIYVILGIQGSRRNEVICDLADAYYSEFGGKIIFFSSPADPLAPNTPDQTLLSWSIIENSIQISDKLPPEASVAFLLTNGKANLIDQLEAIRNTLVKSSQLELARIITVIHCRLLEKIPKLRGWYEACIHFSDVVLLSRHERVSNKWLRALTKSFEKRHIPCLFEMVKKGRVPNVLNVLYAEPRRYSLAFDKPDSPEDNSLDRGLEIVIEGNVEEDYYDEDLRQKEDAYFEKNGKGQRKIQIPDLAKLLVKD